VVLVEVVTERVLVELEVVEEAPELVLAGVPVVDSSAPIENDAVVE